jgi:hypothetical protein
VEVLRFARAVLPLAAIALLGPPGVARPAVAGAADPPWEPPACRIAVTARPATPAVAWFRTDALLDATGTLSGQRVTLGVVGGPTRRIDLPAESFAAGPARGVVLVGDDDGARSRLRAVDVERGCATTIATEAAVIRSAVFTPALDATFEHRVDRATRADLGVWRRPARGGTAVRVLPGLAPDVAHGRTFATDLRWASDGRLAVASCGELACRTRLLDPASGLTVAASRTGPMLGVAAGRIIAYGVCPGFPCQVRAVDPASGATEVIVKEAGPAVLGDGVLVFERAGRLTRLDLRARTEADVPVSEGLEPLRGGSTATAGVDAAAGRLTVELAGRPVDPANLRRLDPATSTIEPVVEVQP